MYLLLEFGSLSQRISSPMTQAMRINDLYEYIIICMVALRIQTFHLEIKIGLERTNIVLDSILELTQVIFVIFYPT